MTNVILGALDFDKVIAFFRDRHVDQKCPCCSGDQWTIITRIQDFSPGLVSMKIDETGFGHDLAFHGIPVVTVECQNCAFIRLHSWKTIAEWDETTGKDTP